LSWLCRRLGDVRRLGSGGRGWFFGLGNFQFGHLDDEIDFGARGNIGTAGAQHVDADALGGIVEHVARFNQPTAVFDAGVGDILIVDIKAHDCAFRTAAGEIGPGTIDFDGINGWRGVVERGFCRRRDRCPDVWFSRCGRRRGLFIRGSGRRSGLLNGGNSRFGLSICFRLRLRRGHRRRLIWRRR
jgi:hypothetical protein